MQGQDDHETSLGDVLLQMKTVLQHVAGMESRVGEELTDRFRDLLGQLAQRVSQAATADDLAELSKAHTTLVDEVGGLRDAQAKLQEDLSDTRDQVAAIARTLHKRIGEHVNLGTLAADLAALVPVTAEPGSIERKVVEEIDPVATARLEAVFRAAAGGDPQELVAVDPDTIPPGTVQIGQEISST